MKAEINPRCAAGDRSTVPEDWHWRPGVGGRDWRPLWFSERWLRRNFHDRRRSRTKSEIGSLGFAALEFGQRRGFRCDSSLIANAPLNC